MIGTWNSLIAGIAWLGDFCIGLVYTAGRAALLLAQFPAQALHLIPVLNRHPQRHLRRVIEQMFLCGVLALPVVCITAIFSGMVIAGQTGDALKAVVGLDPLGPIIGATMTRELGPVLTAIIVAGFVGGGMSSTIATMTVNEEIDALTVMGIHPVRFLYVPRLIAMLLVMPILTVFADVVGIWGGMVVAAARFGYPKALFLKYTWQFLQVEDPLFGFFKAIVFGILICTISCEQGYSATGGAEGVGRATMRSVVYSFLLILVFNYLLYGIVWQLMLAIGWGHASFN
ncbi:MAG: MlaE family ABC transporter permease [Planctomycetota bacterium]